MTLSVIIPTWSATEELADMALRLCQQVKPMCDQLVVTEDGNYDFRIESIADVYLIHERLGHGTNLKLGLGSAVGDFVAIINSDVEIKEGNLRDLCVPDKIVSTGHPTLFGQFFVAPRQMLLAYPPYDVPGLEGIDNWCREFRSRNSYLLSDKVSFFHPGQRSYYELKIREQKQALEEAGQRKEVDPQRHKARLLEDPEYAERWADKE